MKHAFLEKWPRVVSDIGKLAFRVPTEHKESELTNAISPCPNILWLGDEKRSFEVEIAFSLDSFGMQTSGTLNRISNEMKMSKDRIFEVAKRAILRCKMK